MRAVFSSAAALSLPRFRQLLLPLLQRAWARWWCFFLASCLLSSLGFSNSFPSDVATRTAQPTSTATSWPVLGRGCVGTPVQVSVTYQRPLAYLLTLICLTAPSKRRCCFTRTAPTPLIFSWDHAVGATWRC